MGQDLEGKVAFVSGGGRGIGRAAALALARSGARVALGCRTLSEGQSVVREIESSGGGALFVPLDVTSNSAWRAAIATTTEHFGRLDILVANAGISIIRPTQDLSLADFRDVNTVNLKGAYLGLQHAVAAMRAHGEGGSIVLVASIVGKIGTLGTVPYAASKGGLRLLAKAAALELANERIRVNSVHPGLVRTDMTAGFDEGQFSAAIPMGRFGQPEEIADIIVYAASDHSEFMTGSELVADGGFSIH